MTETFCRVHLRLPCLVVALVTGCGSRAPDRSPEATGPISVPTRVEDAAPLDLTDASGLPDLSGTGARADAATALPPHEPNLIECSFGPGTPERDAGPPLPPFRREAASAALAGVDAQPCLRLASPPLASVHAKLAFLPTGVVNTTATVDDPPDAPANVVTCIVQRVNRLRVPAFSGGPVTVGKRFTLRQ